MNIEQKQGNPTQMHGKLTAYAKVIGDSRSFHGEESPIQAMIDSGWLVAMGNYRDQNSLKDFLMQEMGTSLDDEQGMRDFVEGLGGIEGALDPEKFSEKMKQFEEMQEFIPTPAKMVLMRTEQDILSQEGDIFYLGEYSNPANANLAVNAMTILYQAQYRESQIHSVRSEIDDMIYGIGATPSQSNRDNSVEQLILAEQTPIEIEIDEITETVERTLLRKFIPELLLCLERGDRRDSAENDLRRYLDSYGHKNDIERLIELTETNQLSPERNRLILLYSQKIDAVLSEKFDLLTPIVNEIIQLETKVQESLNS